VPILSHVSMFLGLWGFNSVSFYFRYFDWCFPLLFLYKKVYIYVTVCLENKRRNNLLRLMKCIIGARSGRGRNVRK
jgi:hypothetical protein